MHEQRGSKVAIRRPSDPHIAPPPLVRQGTKLVKVGGRLSVVMDTVPVPETKCYKALMYVCNSFLFLFGAVVIGLVIWIKSSSSGAAINASFGTWISMGLGAGAALCFITFIGVWGTRNADYLIGMSSTNWALLIYFVLMVVLLLLQLALTSLFVLFYTQTGSAQDSDVADTTLDSTLRSQFGSHQSEWVSIQNNNECCGYDETSDALKTGNLCTKISYELCRPIILRQIKSQMLYFLIGLGVLCVLVTVCVTCSLCLTCCVTRPSKSCASPSCSSGTIARLPKSPSHSRTNSKVLIECVKE